MTEAPAPSSDQESKVEREDRWRLIFLLLAGLCLLCAVVLGLLLAVSLLDPDAASPGTRPIRNRAYPEPWQLAVVAVLLTAMGFRFLRLGVRTALYEPPSPPEERC